MSLISRVEEVIAELEGKEQTIAVRGAIIKANKLKAALVGVEELPEKPIEELITDEVLDEVADFDVVDEEVVTKESKKK